MTLLTEPERPQLEKVFEEELAYRSDHPLSFILCLHSG